MRVAVIGCREVSDYDEVMKRIKEELPKGCSEIVSGAAEGVDTIAKSVSEELNIPYTGFEPDYTKFGKSAPLVRNTQIVEYSDILLAYWDYKSDGTKYTIGEAIRLGRKILVVSI